MPPSAYLLQDHVLHAAIHLAPGLEVRQSLRCCKGPQHEHKLDLISQAGRKVDMDKPLEAIKASWFRKLGCQDACGLPPEARLVSWLFESFGGSPVSQAG